ncbi:MAG: phosphatidylglycerophosphatase A [Desulforhopalus sp.]|nr:phosphatidylglycerophosphatase A [Desulforhopalus sp.]
MNQLIIALATGLYAGKIGKAPGTFGSLAAFLPWLLIKDLSLPVYGFFLGAFFVLGFFVSGSAEKILDEPDAGCIVIDEFLGMFVTLLAAPPHPLAWAIGFLFFRFFDIYKPFPVCWFDTKINGGIGIMMDDVIAGLYAFLSLQLLWWAGSLLF